MPPGQDPDAGSAPCPGAGRATVSSTTWCVPRGPNASARSARTPLPGFVSAVAIRKRIAVILRRVVRHQDDDVAERNRRRGPAAEWKAVRRRTSARPDCSSPTAAAPCSRQFDATARGDLPAVQHVHASASRSSDDPSASVRTPAGGAVDERRLRRAIENGVPIRRRCQIIHRELEQPRRPHTGLPGRCGNSPR